MGAFADKTGKRFGRVLVLRRDTTGSDGKIWWLCLCDCGKEIRCKGVRLKPGVTSSCGCYSQDRARELGKAVAGRRRGRPSARRLPNGEAARNSLISAYKAGAIARGHAFTLTVEEFHTLVKAPCTYCGCPPGNTKRNHYHSTFTYNGIDRIDNERGYSMDNCTTCCTACNYSKHTRSVSEFLAWVKCVYVRNFTCEEKEFK